MTPEQQRIAIAAACGYKAPDTSLPMWCEGEEPFRFIPDFTENLNAMHSTEAGLVGHQMIKYQAELSKIGTKNPHVACWDLIHATAAQRAEAFLRTIGKWVE